MHKRLVLMLSKAPVVGNSPIQCFVLDTKQLDWFTCVVDEVGWQDSLYTLRYRVNKALEARIEKEILYLSARPILGLALWHVGTSCKGMHIWG